MKQNKTVGAILILSFSIVYADQEVDFFDLGKEESPLLYPKRYEECFKIANDYFAQGKIDLAIKWFLKSIKKNENSPQPYFNLGVCYESKREFNKAIEAYKDAILHRLDYPKAHQQLAKLLHQQGDIPNAINHFQEALKYDPSLVASASTVARLLVAQERFKESIPYFEKAVAAQQNDIQLNFEYANTLATVNQNEKALDQYQKLLELRPNDSGILYNTAFTLKKLGRIEEAMPLYEKTLSIKPNHAEAHFSLGLAYLSIGDFKRGWKEYEWRWQRNTQLSPREFKQPLWDGSRLDGKTLFLHAEQGLGDTFQFIRYAKVIKEQYGGTIIVAVQKPLQTIIGKCCPYIDRVITLDYVPQHFDFQAPLLSLPCILNTELDSVPCPDPYIIPDTTLVDHWKKQLANDNNLKVGICWQGNNKYSTPFLRAVVAAKSINLKKFTPFAFLEGISLYSLQKETGVTQLKSVSSRMNIITFDDNFDQQYGRFMDTAALIKNLDLVITIDTSIAHLAGAIGTPVWLLLPEPTDWRWMLERADTPWYPNNMRLFRQAEPDNWQEVIERITQELAHHITEKKQNKFLLQNSTKDTPIEVRELEMQQELIDQRIKQLSQQLMHYTTASDHESVTKAIESMYILKNIKASNEQKIAALKG